MNYPNYIEVDNIKYKINTDFKIAIRCNEIANDENIGDYERPLAILYLLYGENVFKCTNLEKLMELTKKYLACGEEIEETHDKPDMDYVKDYSYIYASFMSDYHMNIDEENIHWWKFNKLLNGLSNSEFGNCCILNKIRNLRTMDLKQIKDDKQRQKMAELQQQFALEKRTFSREEEEAMNEFENLLKEGD